MSNSGSTLSQELLDAIDHMQAFPASVQQLLSLSQDPTSAPRDLVDVIQRDPVLTIKVLRVVNSAYYNLPRQIASVDHAVVYLGLNTVKHLALSLISLGMTPTNPPAAIDPNAYLRHSLATAAVARQLALRFPELESQDLFIAGLLHDFGKLVLAHIMPTPFKKAVEYCVWHETDLHDALLAVTGINQAEVAALLLQRWHFPRMLWQAIGNQHESAHTTEPATLCLYAANQLAKQMGMDFYGAASRQAWSAGAEQALGGSLLDVMASLGDIWALVRDAQRCFEC